MDSKKILTLITVLLIGTNIQTLEINCTKSHLMSEITLEDYRKYCLSTFCQCFNKIGFNREGCAPQWKGDLADGLAMFWAFDNFNSALDIDCTKYRSGLRFTARTELDKQFILMRLRSGSEKKEISHDLSKIPFHNVFTLASTHPRFKADGLFEIGLTHENPTKGLEKSLLEERYLSAGIVETGASELSWNTLDGDNYYPISYVVSIASDYTVPEIQTLIFGPMGGRDNPLGPAYFLIDEYFDNSLKLKEYTILVSAVDIEDNYYFKLNSMFSSIKLHSNFYTCLGRTTSPITNRTVWTGDGCRPQPFYRRSIRDYLNANYYIDCSCRFQSLGFNAPDIDPNQEQVKGFEFPRDVKPVKYIEPTHGTVVTVVISSIFILIGLIFIALTVALFVYFKFFNTN